MNRLEQIEIKPLKSFPIKNWVGFRANYKWEKVHWKDWQIFKMLIHC